MFDSKIAIVVRDDLAAWQKLNITAFLTSGIVRANPEIIGEPYVDAEGNNHMRLLGQPVIILAGPAKLLTNIRKRAFSRGIETAVYIEEMFATGHDAANRSVFAEHGPDEENVVGIALRAEKKIVDKITKGAKMHG